MKYDISKKTAPSMPTLRKGTECVRLLLSQASKDMHEPLVPMIFPVLGAHLSGVEFQYPDLSWKEPCGMMANLVADSGGNKGQLSNIVGALCRDFRLVGVQNRNLTPGASPRFRFPKGARCGIYNLPVLSLLSPGEPLYIAEGSSDCWALLSAGHKAVAIAAATLLSRQDVQVLVSLSRTLGTTFHMYPDRDAPGERLFLPWPEKS